MKMAKKIKMKKENGILKHRSIIKQHIQSERENRTRGKNKESI